MDKAVCYIRVSTIEQATEGVSLKAQEERLRRYCLANNLEVIEVIRDEGVSGTKKLSQRPGGAELLDMVAKFKVNNVVTLKLDRLFRNAEDSLHHTTNWDKKGVSLHLADMGGQAINTGSAMGKFFLNVMSGFAELERNLIAERTSLALNHKKSHREAYSPTPYGFNRQDDFLVYNDNEKAIIEDIKRMRESGWSFGKIADILNFRNVPTKNEKRWYPSTVSYICKNDLYRWED